MSSEQSFCGWVPNPDGVDAYLVNPKNKHPLFGAASSNVAGYDKVDTHLWELLIKCSPNYTRGAQLHGDCVSWGCELACTTLIAKQCCKLGSLDLFCEAATEPIYGGSRCEIPKITFAGYSDGSYGAAAAEWVRDYGVLLRVDYSAETGNSEHDLRKYDGNRVKEWGAYGCGGKQDKGMLDAVAKKHPVLTTSLCKSFDEVAATIAGSKCPVTIASSYGTDMRRNSYGECSWNNSWQHQMVLLGVRFGARPGAWCCQSWGPNVASGPTGVDTMPENIAGFGWWIPAKDIDKICSSGDCHSIGDVDGWEIDPFEWSDLWG